MMHRAIGMLLAAWSVSAVSFAQSPAPAKPTEEKRADVLAGPQVREPEHASLVEHEYDGGIRRPDVPAEVAAVRLLDLPRAVMDKIDALMAKRDRFFDSFVENNLDLLNKLDTAGKTNDKLDQAMLGVEALTKLAPLARNGSLRKQIRAVLPREAAVRFDALLAEYRDAIVAQEHAKDPKKPRFVILAGERAESVMREVAAAFQRLEKSGVLIYRYFFKDVELSKEQETAIRALLDEFVEETKGSPTKQQEQKIFFAVMSRLDTKQQTELIRRFKSGASPKKASPAAPKTHKDAEPVR